MFETQDNKVVPVVPELQTAPDTGGQASDDYRVRFAHYESLFQDDMGEIREPVGQMCNRLLCFQVKDAEDQSLQPCLFWLSVVEGSYYRFFVDVGAYIVQWFRADATLFEEEIREEHHTPVLDLSQLYELQGQRIISIMVDRVWQDSLYILRLTLLLSGDHFLRLEYAGDRTFMAVA